MDPGSAHGPKRLKVLVNNSECGKVDAWPYGTQARWSLDADYENTDHLERTFFVPRRPELPTAHKGHGFKHTRGRILRFGIDCVDCRLLFPVEQRHVPLHLPLGVTQQGGAVLVFLRARRA